MKLNDSGASEFGDMCSIDQSLVRSAIGDVPLCLGGEVDCVQGTSNISAKYYTDRSAEPGAPHPGLEGCVELKTNMLIRNDRQQKTFERYVLDPIAM
jgi:RAT1-interacting protein